MLCVIGDLVEDVVVHLTAPLVFGTDNVASVTRRRGGSAANVAAAAAAGGTPVRFIGRIGLDAAGMGLLDDLQKAGVDPRVQRMGRTGSVIVLVDPNGERTMFPDRAAAADLDTVPHRALDGVTWLHVPAYSLYGGDIGRTTVDAVDRARSGGATISVDASSVGLIERVGKEDFVASIASLEPEVLFCNADEAALIDVEATIPFGGAVAVVKRGPDPASAYVGGTEVASEPAIAIDEARDTTGAGDAFAAGFIVASMRGDDVASAIRSGHLTAAQTLRRNVP